VVRQLKKGIYIGPRKKSIIQESPVKSFFVPKDSKRKDFKSLTGIVISLPCTLTFVNAVQQVLEEGRGGRRRESLWMEC
jgi:hypothetical protein